MPQSNMFKNDEHLCPICGDELYVSCSGYRDLPFIDGKIYTRICHGCSEVPKMHDWDEEKSEIVYYSDFDIKRLYSVKDMVEEGWTSDEAKFHIKAVKASIKNNLELRCSLCDHTCNSTTGLKLHVRSKHPKSNENKIVSAATNDYKQRQKEFSKNTKGLENHKEPVQINELTCLYCGKKTNSKAGLTLHIKAKHE